MSARLVVLGLLRQGPLHGYELKRVIEEEMGDWTAIPFGSIYFALGKLRDEGSIAETAQGREGRRPEKTVYSITGKGREMFLALLRESLGSREVPRFELDQALAFSEALPKEEVAGFFRARVADLEGHRARLKAHEEAQTKSERVPLVAKGIFLHSELHLEAELAWSKAVLEALEGGKW